MAGIDSTTRDETGAEGADAAAQGVESAAATSPETGIAAAATEPLPRRVLLVEDEELVAMAMVDELERLGWSVVGPAETLEEAQGLVSTGISLDAAILDVNLRGRWVHALAEDLARRGVPFVVCTGYEMVDPDGRFAGAPLIAKPIAIDRLGAALDNLLGRNAPSQVPPGVSTD